MNRPRPVATSVKRWSVVIGGAGGAVGVGWEIVATASADYTRCSKIAPFPHSASFMTNSADNPLLQPWDRPHGLPPFECVRPEQFKPALEAAMRAHLLEIDAIAESADAP